MHRRIRLVTLGIALMTLLTLQSTTAYGQFRLGIRGWFRGQTTAWYAPAPGSPVTARPPTEVPRSQTTVAAPARILKTEPAPAAMSHAPIIERLGDGGNMNFRGMVSWK